MAPSPIAKVIKSPFDLIRSTTNDFCLGDILQQITLFEITPKRKNNLLNSLFDKIFCKETPSIITDISFSTIFVSFLTLF